MTAPRIMRLSSANDFHRFLSGTLIYNKARSEFCDPKEWDFVLLGSQYDDDGDYVLFERVRDAIYDHRGRFADEVYAIQHAHKLWPHWGREARLAQDDAMKPGRWSCIRCGRTSDDLPARFEGDYESPICDKCA